MKDNVPSYVVALLGIVVGALAVLTVQSASGRMARREAPSEEWRKMNLVLNTLDANYVDPVDHKKVTDAAVSAALSSLDPHSIYMLPQTLESSEESLAGNFDGIGIQFNVPNDTAVVIEVIPGGPSEKIGLQPGDRILKVDSLNIAGVKYPQDSMVRHIKGRAGTKVSVVVRRDGEDIPFEITRGKIPTHSVDAAFMVGDTTGYLRLSKFSRTSDREVAEAGKSLLDQGMRKLILDLRDNSGGFLDQALNLSNMFLPKGAQIVYMEGVHRRREDFKADGKGFMRDIALEVLINEGTASSSEILAGALQDNGRARIVGRRSFGKGLVQEPFYFSDGSGMRITVARFYTPSGRCIQKPYSEDYEYEIYRRYDGGEMVSADSMKVENGGILPDVFVPADTTKAGAFYMAVTRKATAMRFASAFFDAHSGELKSIDDYSRLLVYLDKHVTDKAFLDYASRIDKISPTEGEWKTERQYLMTQVRALVGRYSRLGDNAYYHLFLSTDNCFKTAMNIN